MSDINLLSQFKKKVVYVADAKFGVGGDELLNGAQLEGQAQGAVC